MKAYKQIAAFFGYSLWYSREWRVWMCTKDGFESQIFCAQEIRAISLERFQEILIENPEHSY